jgi:hypothetical protein
MQNKQKKIIPTWIFFSFCFFGTKKEENSEGRHSQKNLRTTYSAALKIDGDNFKTFQHKNITGMSESLDR